MTLFVILSIIIIGLLEGIPLVKRKIWNDFAVVAVILIIAVCIQVSSYLGMETPITFLEKCFEPIGKAIFKNTLT